MRLYMDSMNLNYFETLASKTRLLIIQLLAKNDMNIKELSEALDVSSSIITRHIKKLESAGIITTRYVNKDGSRQKMCVLLSRRTEILVPDFSVNRYTEKKKVYETSLPVGHFTELEAIPPCGLASEKNVLGDLDTPTHMFAPRRVEAQLIWFGEGFVEYTLPNYIQKEQTMTNIEIMGEFGSEAPGYNHNWPSEILVKLNNIPICTFTTPGDFGEPHGINTPDWWTNNQYGILVIVRVDKKGVSVNGEYKSDITIDQFKESPSCWKLRFEACSKSNGGGITIYGKKFGNYSHDIVFKAFYE